MKDSGPFFLPFLQSFHHRIPNSQISVFCNYSRHKTFNLYVCAYFSTIKKMKFSFGGLTLSENLIYPVLELAVQYSVKRSDLS